MRMPTRILIDNLPWWLLQKISSQFGVAFFFCDRIERFAIQTLQGKCQAKTLSRDKVGVQGLSEEGSINSLR